jgi:hypothetical protein
VTAINRGAEAAPLHILPQLWFRNTWSWEEHSVRPRIYHADENEVIAEHVEMGIYRLYVDGEPELLFTDNDTNFRKLDGLDVSGHFKDGFHERLIGAAKDAVNPARSGTKCAAWHHLSVPAQGSVEVRLRLCRQPVSLPFKDFADIFTQRKAEADSFYARIQLGLEDEDARAVQRQAFAGLIWSKQFYHYDVPRWLKGDPGQPTPPSSRRHGRNWEWQHLNNADIISMPDKWEYPWYAAWDLAFHMLPFALIDPGFAKRQLVLLTREWYMHPNGQIPAYEWAFGDVNPPVHAWAAWRVFQIDRVQRGGRGDLPFLERVFHKLLMNFTWWVNRKDTDDRNVFQGGFLGLDNIGVFDRSAELPTGGFIDQSDGTSWMAMYSLNMMRIALELALHNNVYEDIATKFFEHFLTIAEAMTVMGEGELSLWDDEDKFFYDVLHFPNGHMERLKVRSMVGLIPLFAVETIDADTLEKLPGFAQRLEWFLNYRPDLAALVSHWEVGGKGERRLLSLLRGQRMKQLLRRMLDETEFLSDFGIRALSRYHAEHPYEFDVNGSRLMVGYQPAESNTNAFGGNSNWRGPIWFPVNFLIIESLQKFHYYYGDDFKVECPTGSGNYMTIKEVSEELTRRLARIFLKGPDGKRPVYGHDARMQTDANFRDHLLFYEYFHGDNGRGVGASHQTGWTALIAKLLQHRRPTG